MYLSPLGNTTIYNKRCRNELQGYKLYHNNGRSIV